MKFFDLFRLKEGGIAAAPALTRCWTDDGVSIRFAEPLRAASVDALLGATDKASAQETYLVAYLSQLVVEERCRLETTGLTLPWNLIYELRSSPDHGASLEVLGLPTERALVPILDCRSTLADADFDLIVDGWAEDGAVASVSAVQGAIVTVDGEDYLLPGAAWRTYAAIEQFARRTPDTRTQHENELAWGAIRPHADAAGALYRTPYLETTYVLTPQTLRLPLSKQMTPFGRVLTVEPTFDGAPAGWLRAFDGFRSVQTHYDLTPHEGGHVRVVISEPVRQVLSVIKQEMQGRQVAGSRAERFVHNPWAFLGEVAHEVLREDQFAQDKAGAGALATVFSVHERYQDSRIDHVDLIVTEHFESGGARSESATFANPRALQEFIDALEAALKQERLQFPWNEYDLTVDGESTRQLDRAREVMRLWKLQPAHAISFEDIYELGGYSSRIEGIGVAKAIYVPLIQKPSGEEEDKPGWLPTDLTPMMRVTLAGHEGQVIIPLTQEWVEEFGYQVQEAEKTGAKEVVNNSLPTPVETGQARTLHEGFKAMLSAATKLKTKGVAKDKTDRPPRETLLVKMNYHQVDYAEERKNNLAVPADAEAKLPQSLRPSITLKKHQLFGVAWFQRLVACAPMTCRGALLADDMGLGKTLQLLIVLAQYYEQSPHAEPTMILAPKSLIRNWETETRKFFSPAFPQVLVLYGEELRKRKQPLSLIDQQLQSRGFVELLRPDWIDHAKIIITTYEVLTSYEFSFARQRFAFVICDEAQRIKTPGTQASIAVRALKTDFRIACTGTPVENSLADLWCLFDFVQPGLLGGLEDFGRTYRRPIECDTEDQKEALTRLQDAIAPQTLRRTKLELKEEFKKKYFAHRGAAVSTVNFKEKLEPLERMEIAISPYQNILYLAGLKKLQDASEERDGRRRARASFGALHLMKAVCAEPYCLPGRKFLPYKADHEIKAHLQNSTKLAALIEQLRMIKAAGEKAIIFTELREVQTCLFYFMKEIFGLKPSIINGDSENRQSYIDRFSETTGFNVIILSTLAAGAGLNVTAANHVFHFTRAWNPAKEAQATDRAYRIGQEKDVFVYCPIVVSEDYPTFDVRLDEMLRRKAGLADATLGDSVLEAMLNGSGKDVSFTELLGAGHAGAELTKRLLTMDDVDRLDGFGFEILCKLLWSKAGYVSQVTPKRGGDGGIDVLAIKGREGELLQCKSSGGSEVGWDAIKEVTAGAARYQARFPGTLFRRLAVTNQRFTSGAREHAQANRVTLVERVPLKVLLGKHPVDNYEFETEVLESSPMLDSTW